jgi:hypothetical protein
MNVGLLDGIGSSRNNEPTLLAKVSAMHGGQEREMTLMERRDPYPIYRFWIPNYGCGMPTTPGMPAP